MTGEKSQLTYCFANMIMSAIAKCSILSFFHSCFLLFLQVSEKRWYWLKVFALATIRDWDALEKFSKEKRPPIGKVL